MALGDECNLNSEGASYFRVVVHVTDEERRRRAEAIAGEEFLPSGEFRIPQTVIEAVDGSKGIGDSEMSDGAPQLSLFERGENELAGASPGREIKQLPYTVL